MMTPMTPLRLISRLLLCTALLSVAACSHGPDKSKPPKAELLFSPNGEPLTGGPLGQAPCAEVLARWFDRMDANHNGAISRDDFMADARTQFSRMDLDHDGKITPAELSEFRAPYAPPPEPYRGGPNGGSNRGGPGGGGQQRGGDSPGLTRSSVTQEDPVMSADVHLLFRVSLEDFMAQADQVFTRLDKGRKGSLNRADLVASCPVKAADR